MIGIRSRRTIDTGTVQNGLKLTSMILLLSSGDGRDGRPTTAVWRLTDDAVLDRLDLRRRDVDHDVAALEVLGGRLQPLDIDLELGEPRVARHVEAVEGLLAHDAVDGDAVARLEAAHRRLDIGIEDVAFAGIGVEIADDDQPPAQRHHAGVAVAEAQPLGRRHQRPAAVREDALVFADREFGGLHGRGRQRRQRGLRHVDGARGAVEVLAELALLVLLDQRLQEIVFGNGGTRQQRGAATPAPSRLRKPRRSGPPPARWGAFAIATSNRRRGKAPDDPVMPRFAPSGQAPRRNRSSIFRYRSEAGDICGRSGRRKRQNPGRGGGRGKSHQQGRTLRADRGSGRSRTAPAGAATCSAW